MSFREKRRLSLTGLNSSNQNPEQIQGLFQKILEDGMHGICYSAYEEGQEPGHILSEEQIRKRMTVIAPHSKWIRSFSCREGHELIPKIAHEFGLKTLVGAWLGKDKDDNEAEIAGLIKLANEGYVDIAAVGNEVMYRKDMEESELLEYIHQVKNAVSGIQVGYVDAYYEFTDRPKIAAACDVILSNCYPFWEGCHIDYSLPYMKLMFQEATKASLGKKVIITETGWPNKGTAFEGAAPSRENALRYFVNAQQWAAEDNIELFYFTSFDESWKVGGEGDVGAHWGLWDKDGELKY